MIHKLKLITLMIALVAIPGISLQSCCDDCDEPRGKIYNAPSFKATNVSVTAAPICKRIVPTNFKVGDKIVSQWADNSGKIQHESLSSSITLIEL